MDVDTSVREFLRDRIAVRHDNSQVSAHESLLDSGLLDSASILELVAFLEDRFELEISDEELVPENFETIESIVGLVNSKTGGKSAEDDTPS